jgi:hypothetical protein
MYSSSILVEGKDFSQKAHFDVLFRFSGSFQIMEFLGKIKIRGGHFDDP